MAKNNVKYPNSLDEIQNSLNASKERELSNKGGGMESVEPDNRTGSDSGASKMFSVSDISDSLSEQKLIERNNAGEKRENNQSAEGKDSGSDNSAFRTLGLRSKRKLLSLGAKAIMKNGAGTKKVLYLMALLNDAPDLAEPLYTILSFGFGGVFDFLFDLVFFVWFRYALRQYLKTPKLKMFVYAAGILESLPFVGMIPFWTICTWLVLREIENEAEEGGG